MLFISAYDALFNHCELKMGESVLIHAVGSGVGTAALQLARLVVDQTFPLEKTSDAHEYMETNASFGKIILTID